MWQLGKRSGARDRAREVLPAAQRVIAAAKRIQEDYKARVFNSSLPLQARQILEAYSNEQPRVAEIERTRALAVSAFAERGEMAALTAMFKSDTTTLRDYHDALKKLDDAFLQLCFPKRPE
jgi:predicted ArsR family transcriptional regulator